MGLPDRDGISPFSPWNFVNMQNATVPKKQTLPMWIGVLFVILGMGIAFASANAARFVPGVAVARWARAAFNDGHELTPGWYLGSMLVVVGVQYTIGYLLGLGIVRKRKANTAQLVDCPIETSQQSGE